MDTQITNKVGGSAEVGRSAEVGGSTAEVLQNVFMDTLITNKH